MWTLPALQAVSAKARVHKRENLPDHPLVQQLGVPVHRVLCGQRGNLGVLSMVTWQHVNCKRCLKYKV